MNKHDKKYIQSSDDIEKQIDTAYKSLVDDVIPMVAGVDATDQFMFSKHQAIKKKAEESISKLRITINTHIRNSTKDVWTLSNMKNDELVLSKLPIAPSQYLKQNTDALNAFLDRSVGGFRVSDRVWRNTGSLLSELESSIQAAIQNGKSADQLSRDIRMYLKNPDMKFRRIRDKYGKLQPSTVAAEFHPGQGVYRSSYQNALRLARHEINKAYRKSDWLRWSQMDMVIGYKIIPSPRSATVCPICQALQGVYPKWFVFTSWHVSCRCTCVPIMCNDEEFDQLQAAILSGGELPKFKQPPLPGNFTEYYQSKKEKISTLAPVKLPDWVLDNQRMLRLV